jgi:hypothetical protein
MVGGGCGSLASGAHGPLDLDPAPRAVDGDVYDYGKWATVCLEHLHGNTLHLKANTPDGGIAY